ncbi:pilus assembly protein TadG-related protein [Methylobacter sp. Wu1]|uniref:pilus assembly protein TadG-related protein n=1 Tax=Methylobacter sp. Wu1 TaxID=3119359 RepID=UPI002F959841
MSAEINTLKHGRQRHRRPATKSLARQRGAIGILGASVLLLSVLFTALAVDTGRLMLEQRRLQKIADMAALDGARALGTCGSDIDKAVKNNAELNNHTGDILDVALGDVLTDKGIRVFDTPPKDEDFPKAVRVTAGNTKVPASLVAGGWLGNTVNLQATAVAEAPPMGALSVGSYLALLDTNKSMLDPLLNGLLGISANTRIVSYEGLATANVTLLELINAQGEVGTVDKLLDLDVSMKDFVILMVKALSNQKEQPTVAIDLLETIAARVDGNLMVDLGELLQLELPAPPAALNAQINVLDLVGLAAEVANKNHLVQATLPLSIPGVASTTLKTYIIEPPQIAIGPAGRDADGEWITRAHTAQVNTQLSLTLLGGLNLGSIGTGLVNLDLAITGADARAGFESFDCDGTDRTAVVGHVVQAARIIVGRFDDISKRNPKIEPSLVVNLPKVLVIEASAGLGAGQSAENVGTLTFDTIPGTLPTDNNKLGTAVSTLLDGLANDLSLEITDDTLLGSILNPVLDLLGLGRSDKYGLLNLVADLLKPVLRALDPLLSGLLKALGLSVAGADISVLNVEDGRPQLLI